MKLRLITKQQGESINRRRKNFFPRCLLFQDYNSCIPYDIAEYLSQSDGEKFEPIF